jgi:biopolymer transport protein ExbD
MLSQRSLLNSPQSSSEELSLAHIAPEINLIPFIDVLLVILIFLMISTTFTQYQELSIQLPSAQGTQSKVEIKEIKVAITKDGRYAVNGSVVEANQLGQKFEQFASQWEGAAGEVTRGKMVISADAKATHQAVMLVLELASQANISQIVFATQDNPNSKAKRKSSNP